MENIGHYATIIGGVVGGIVSVATVYFGYLKVKNSVKAEIEKTKTAANAAETQARDLQLRSLQEQLNSIQREDRERADRYRKEIDVISLEIVDVRRLYAEAAANHRDCEMRFEQCQNRCEKALEEVNRLRMKVEGSPPMS